MRIKRLIKGVGEYMRITVLATSICLTIIGLANATDARAMIRQHTDIPAQSLDNALRTLAKDRGFHIVYLAMTVRSLSTQGATGDFTRDEALAQLLQGTGLAYLYLDDETVTIVQATPSNDASPGTRADDRKEGKNSSSDGFRMAQVDQGANSQSSTIGNITSASQDSTKKAQLEEIIVTARKREETTLSTPVELATLSQGEIERHHVTSFDDLTHLVTDVRIDDDNSSVQGGTISIRGIGAAASTTTANQAVAFNIDGTQVSLSSVRQMSQMDMEQIAVLKGPQGLFFGKNSPGGIISVRTADPTDHFEAKVSLGYEFVGNEKEATGYISTPLTDTLGARVAFYLSGLTGWVTNQIPSSDPYSLSNGYRTSSFPDDQQADVRLTLKYEPSDRFNARFKFNYGDYRSDGPGENGQYVYCPLRTPQVLQSLLGKPAVGPYLQAFANDNCVAGNNVWATQYGSSFTSVDPRFGVGIPFIKQDQILSSLEANYKVTDNLTLTSVTSFYKLERNWLGGVVTTTNPTAIQASYATPSLDQEGEEFRLTSDFKTPVNFIVGGYFEKNDFRDTDTDAYDATAPIVLAATNPLHIAGYSYSGFGQIKWDVIDTLELSGGGRYSHESKTYKPDPAAIGIVFPAVPDRIWNNVSPEATIAWRPSQTVTVFGTYKQGFLSGGFNFNGSPFDQEVTKGFEGGVKALLFDGTLRTNLEFYDYKTYGLQVSTLQGFNIITENAGVGRTRGIDFDAIWKTPLEGLTLSGALSYDQAQYLSYPTACYNGQTIAEGCNSAPNAAGVFQTQSLNGHPLIHAPDWSALASAVNEHSIGAKYSIQLSLDAAYTSSFYTDVPEEPASRESGYWLVDAGVRLSNEQKLWDVALLIQNLGNKYYYSSSSAVLGTGYGTGTSGPALPSDLTADVSRGRQIWLRVSEKFY